MSQQPYEHFYLSYNINLLEKLIKSKRNLDKPLHPSHRPLLHVIVLEKDINAIRLLLQNGANPNYLYGFNSVLHEKISINCKNPEIYELLLEYGADVNYQNECGDTIMHNMWDPSINIDLLKIFMKHGADLNIRNNEGLTSLQVYEERLNYYHCFDLQWDIDENKLNEIAEFMKKYTGVVSLILLCLRVIYGNKRKTICRNYEYMEVGCIDIPDWFPDVLLDMDV
jgi:ankyrin repeat protein